MYGTPPGIPGLVQTNITNSAEEKWALLDKDIAISKLRSAFFTGYKNKICTYTKFARTIYPRFSIEQT